MAEEPHLIVVDSGVWAEWFKGTDAATVRRLQRALIEEDVAITPVILTEVLQGFRLDTDFERAQRLLTALPLFILDIEGHVAAARLFRSLRRQGVTVRGTIDCLIAQTCVSTEAELLADDRGFRQIAEHSSLRLCAT